MKHGTYFIGQEVPLEPRKPIQTGDMVAWFVFQTPPKAEESAKAWLEKRGVEAWYPSEIRRRRLARGRRPFCEYEARLVPRYVFARFTGRPSWDVVQTCRFLTRVVGHDGCPLPITDEVMAQMVEVPERLEIIRQRETQKRIVRPGDKVRIRDGVMAGWIVDVAEVHAGIARFVVPLLGDRITEVPVGRVDKLQPLDSVAAG